MKFIKEYPETKGFSGTYAVYELSEQEKLLAGKKYLVNRKFSKFAMENLKHSEMVLKAIKESEYVYGTGFCDTIAECDLFYKCECLQYLLQSIEEQFNEIGKKAFDSAYLCAENKKR